MKIIKNFIITFYSLIVILLITLKITSKVVKPIQIIKIYGDDLIYSSINNTNYVSLDNINQKTVKMFVHIEDQHFYEHSGFDLFRIIKSTIHNLQNDNLQGASTITQQYTRIIYLDNEKSLKRKISELFYSLILEEKYTKDEILEGYLNNLYFGHGIYGIYNASFYFFNKAPSDLSICESAHLIATINNPSLYSPINNYENSRTRKNKILKILLNDKIISKNEYDSALIEIPTIYKNLIYHSPKLFYTDMVLKELKKFNIKKYKKIKVETYYNSLINDYLKTLKINSNNELSLVAFNNEGGCISILGSKNYADSSYNRAILSERQLGSTVKPFLYYQALACGLKPLNLFKSEPTNFLFENAYYSPSNYNNLYENDNITMIQALATSDNIYAIKAHMKIGMKKLVNILKKFDIDAEPIPSAALGSSCASLYKITAAYHALSTLGNIIDPHFIKRIYGDDKLIYEFTDQNENKLDSALCYIINEMLSYTFDKNINNITKATAYNIKDYITNKYAAKSGSTNNDSYMIGFNKNITLGIWSGNDKNELNDPINIKYMWARIMEIYNKSLDTSWYDVPKNIYFVKGNPCYAKKEYKKWIPYRNPLPINASWPNVAHNA